MLVGVAAMVTVLVAAKTVVGAGRMLMLAGAALPSPEPIWM